MVRFLLISLFSLSISASQSINQDVIAELNDMIMGDSATQALIVSHNGKILLEEYGEGYNKTDFVTSQSIAKAF